MVCASQPDYARVMSCLVSRQNSMLKTTIVTQTHHMLNSALVPQAVRKISTHMKSTGGISTSLSSQNTSTVTVTVNVVAPLRLPVSVSPQSIVLAGRQSTLCSFGRPVNCSMSTSTAQSDDDAKVSRATERMRSIDSPTIPRYSNPKAMYELLEEITTSLDTHTCVRNFIGVVEDMSQDAIIVENELFPARALQFYSRFNLGRIGDPSKQQFATTQDKEDYETYYNAARGGGQGDYRQGIQAKIDNVVDCLQRFPGSKRAVLGVPFNGGPGDNWKGSANVSHEDTDEAKCLRELHFYMDNDNRLCCTGFMRAQAAIIFPKNVHFIGTVMHDIADRLNVQVGTYTHIVTTMVHGRE
jgi:hypothetical protein